MQGGQIRTMHEMFEHSTKHYANNRMLGWRERDPVAGTYGPYVWIDYKTVHERRKNLGAGLRYLHEKIGVTEDKYGIGLWSPNRPEWQITDLAAVSQGCYTVSIYDTLGPTTTEFIVNHALIKVIVCSLNVSCVSTSARKDVIAYACGFYSTFQLCFL